MSETIKVQARIPIQDRDYLLQQGNGNLSAGFRKVIRLYKKSKQNRGRVKSANLFGKRPDLILKMNIKKKINKYALREEL